MCWTSWRLKVVSRTSIDFEKKCTLLAKWNIRRGTLSWWKESSSLSYKNVQRKDITVRTRLFNWCIFFCRKRPTLEEVQNHRWLNQVDYMSKKRSRANFTSNRIKVRGDQHSSVIFSSYPILVLESLFFETPYAFPQSGTRGKFALFRPRIFSYLAHS